MIGRSVVGSDVTSTVTGHEFTQMREEFNMEVSLVAVAERDARNAGRMLLSPTPMGAAEIAAAPAAAWQAYDEAAFAQHVEARCVEDEASLGGASMVMIECSGPEREISEELWGAMSEYFEVLLFRGFHVVFADAGDTQIGQYVLAGVMTDLEDWELMTRMYEQEEADLGPPAEPLQEQRLEGMIHEFNRANAKPPVGGLSGLPALACVRLEGGSSLTPSPPTHRQAHARKHARTHSPRHVEQVTESKADIVREHERIFGIDPVEAARVKQVGCRSLNPKP
jgi:hypothetical protein